MQKFFRRRVKNICHFKVFTFEIGLQVIVSFCNMLTCKHYVCISTKIWTAHCDHTKFYNLLFVIYFEQSFAIYAIASMMNYYNNSATSLLIRAQKSFPEGWRTLPFEGVYFWDRLVSFCNMLTGIMFIFLPWQNSSDNSGYIWHTMVSTRTNTKSIISLYRSFLPHCWTFSDCYQLWCYW